MPKINQILHLAIFSCFLCCCQESTVNNQQLSPSKTEPELDLFLDEDLAYVNVPDTSRNPVFPILNNGFFCSHPEEPISAFYEEKNNEELHSFHNQPEKISEKEFNSLSALGHFIHSFKYPESYSQSCYNIRKPKNWENNIPAELFHRTDGYVMSKRQREALVLNRDSIILLMKECLEDASLIGYSFKKTIVDLKAHELIPSLIRILAKQKKKDPTILTTLCLLMKDESDSFQKSTIYNHLYDNQKTNTSIFDKGIPFTFKNMAFIISEAQTFYDQKNTINYQNVDELLAKDTINLCYTSKKVDSLTFNGDNARELTEQEFSSLTALEHFIHSFKYEESYNQSCSIYTTPENIAEVIPANLIFDGEGVCMSERQEDALSAHRDSILFYMGECSKSNQYVNLKFKRKIVELQGHELIPTLINIYEESLIYDPYLLTTLCLLIKNESAQFRESNLYKSLYIAPNDRFYRNFFKRNVPFSRKTEKFILTQAMEVYKTKANTKSSFIKIAGGTYKLGSSSNQLNPLTEYHLQSFEINKYEVTNAQFEQFVDETGYVTTAEERKNALVFRLGLPEFEWEEDSTAFWRFPNGVSEGGIEDKMNHPVTCISYRDAQNYCSWANVHLPTFEQWEVAARSGSSEKYFFSDDQDIYEFGNVWHGENHLNVSKNEDYLTTSPVGSFKPNPLGIYDIYGNVFEFCSGKPEGFEAEWNVVVTRGGSWWCSKASCSAFNSEDLGRVHIDASFSNNGFRVVR